MNVEYIPPKPHYNITFQALEFYVSQIPSGQVLTEKKLMSYLRSLYNDDNLDVDEASIPYAVFRNKDIPFWRYLSSTGLVQEDRFLTSDEAYARKLASEGHSILQNQHGRFKVEDYRETMANPSSFRVLAADQALVRVNDPSDILRASRRPIPHVTLFDDDGNETATYRIESGMKTDI